MEISGQIHKNSLNYSLFSSVNSSIGLSGVAGDASTMFFGTISGGITAELTGGNFWQGAAIGLAVSALNHVAHRSNDLGKCPTCPKKAKVGDTYVDSNGGDWMYFENIGWSPYVTAETLALGSGHLIQSSYRIHQAVS